MPGDIRRINQNVYKRMKTWILDKHHIRSLQQWYACALYAICHAFVPF